MFKSKCVVDRASLFSFLETGEGRDLDKGLVWAKTDEGGDYWYNLYYDINRREITNKRLEEVRNKVKRYLGIKPINHEEEAEWE